MRTKWLGLLCCLMWAGYAQRFQWGWNIGGSTEDSITSLYVDNKGNVYITGRFFNTIALAPGYQLTSNGSSDIFLAKYDTAGNLLWAFNIGGAGSDEGFSVAVDAQGNVYLTGKFAGTVDFSPTSAAYTLTSKGGADVFLAKYDASANLLWAFNIGGNSSNDWGRSIAIDAQGNVYLTGVFEGTADFDPSITTYNLTSNGWQDVFVAKYSPAGNLLWAFNVGGTEWDEGCALAVDTQGNVYVTGWFWGSADFDPSPTTYNLTSNGNWDMFLAKYDALGNLLWAFNVGGAGWNDKGNALAVDTQGNVYVTGWFWGSADFDPSPTTYNLISKSKDIFLAKYDFSGKLIWALSVGGGNEDEGLALFTDLQGNVYMTGTFMGTVDFDPSPFIRRLTSNGGKDLFLAKYDPWGNLLWAYNIGERNNDQGVALFVDPKGSLYLAGNFINAADFDPGPSVHYFTSNGEQDGLIAKYDTTALNTMLTLFSNDVGSLLWDISDAIAVDHLENIYIAGMFQDSIDVLLGPQSYYLYAQDTAYEAFVAKYNKHGVLLWAKRIGGVVWVSDLKVDDKENVYIVGGFKGDLSVNGLLWRALDGIDGYVIVLDSIGTLVESYRLGGKGDDWITAIAIDGAQWHLLGVFEDSVDIGGQWLIAQGQKDFFIVSWDSLKQIKWYVQEGGGTGEVVANHFVRNQWGQWYITGYFTKDVTIAGRTLTSLGGKDVFVYSIDSTGQTRWVLSGGGKGDEWGEEASAEDNNARIQLVGGSTDTATFGNTTVFNHGDSDLLWIAVDTSGAWLWARTIGGKGKDWAEAITIHNGATYIAGNFSDTVDFALGTMKEEKASHGATDMFVARYNPEDGTLQGLLTIGGNNNDLLKGMIVKKDGSFYLTGGFQNIADFNNYLGVSRGSMDYFFAHYSTFGQTYGLLDTVVCDGFYITPWGDTLKQSGLYVKQLKSHYRNDSLLTMIVEVARIDTSIRVTHKRLFAAGGYDNYRWMDCNAGYKVVLDGQDSIYIPSESGSYAVEITYRGCVAISRCYEIRFKEGLLGAKVYPNPAFSSLWVRFEKPVEEVKVELVNVLGHRVWSGHYKNATQITIPIGIFPLGVYWLRVETQGNVKRYKIVHL